LHTVLLCTTILHNSEIWQPHNYLKTYLNLDCYALDKPSMATSTPCRFMITVACMLTSTHKSWGVLLAKFGQAIPSLHIHPISGEEPFIYHSWSYA